MKFFIRNTEKLDYDFLKLIPVEMQKLFIECADENKLNAINKYFNDSKRFVNFEFDAKKVLLQGIRNFVWYDFQDNYVFHIDYYKKCEYGCNLDTLCREITYGNMSFKGYPILLDIFNYLSRNIEKYKKAYYTFHPRKEY